MVRMMKRRSLIAGALLMMVTAASAQTQRQGEAFSIQGYPGQANATRLQGRLLVDVQDLAQITNGSLSFKKGRITLTLPRCEASEPTVDDASRAGFSRAFMKAAIEAMAAIREWGGMLMITVQNGYPVGNNMAGNTIMAYQGRAADSVALASSAASNDSDYRGVELLRNEFNNVQGWADRFAKARSSLSAANITMSENALNDDEEAQKIIRCGQFLAQMFAGGTFQDDGTCH
jgi:hypothetical protein